MMDPWLCCQENNPVSKKTTTKFEFEDNFRPSANDKLPDSREYLAILEEKLKRIKNDPDILAQLRAKKEACMRDLLGATGTERFDEELIDFEFEGSSSVIGSQLVRALAPQKQALNRGEILRIIEHDQFEDDGVDDDNEKAVNTLN
ncbi:unnamed protein product [Phyllotreta striolata]|uniref:Uncharacterized protein n=1 Tax=Phyllotreta striolata TaxID=444603 RepID=A0A9N9TNL1_PHYSR|nr:unnamed protein product [Phyllotreta striolata]